MKISEARKRLEEIEGQHGDLDFAVGHSPSTCRVSFPTWVWCDAIEVVAQFNGRLKTVVAK